MSCGGMFKTVLLAVLLINIAAVFAFWSDKRRAIAGERRIAEATLLKLALLGGSPGALLARRLFRHKTRKEPFSTRLLLIVAVQAGVGIGLLVL